MCSCLEAFAKAFLFITNLVICVSATQKCFLLTDILCISGSGTIIS